MMMSQEERKKLERVKQTRLDKQRLAKESWKVKRMCLGLAREMVDRVVDLAELSSKRDQNGDQMLVMDDGDYDMDEDGLAVRDEGGMGSRNLHDKGLGHYGCDLGSRDNESLVGLGDEMEIIGGVQSSR